MFDDPNPTMAHLTFRGAIEQVTDGLHYRGTLEMAHAIFTYELIFGVAIDKMDTVGKPKDFAAVRQLFQVTLKRDEEVIDLPNQDEYMFFVTALGDMADQFYHHPQVRRANSVVFPKINDLVNKMGGGAPTITPSLTLSGFTPLTPELLQIIKQPKFGMRL